VGVKCQVPICHYGSNPSRLHVKEHDDGATTEMKQRHRTNSEQLK
jgi:hypothetical protein